MIITIILFIAVLGFLVTMHELGHFTVAKLAKVRVLEFGIGLPPRVFGFTRGGTLYSINLLPIGGFVRMLGEEDPSAPDSFAAKSAWRRLAILAAGPAMNAVLPVILLAGVFMLPQSVPSHDVAVTGVAPDSPAAQAGVLPGDVVRTADGRRVRTSADLITAINVRLGADTRWIVERDGRLVELHIAEARVAPPPGQGAVGVSLADARLTVEGVSPGSPAARSGLRAGDLILGAGGRRVLSEDELRAALAAPADEPQGAPAGSADEPQDASAGSADGPQGAPAPSPSSATATVTALRGGEIVTLELPDGAGSLDGLSVTAKPDERQALGPVAALGAGLGRIADILLLLRNEASRWIAGTASIEVAGPIGIAQITGDVARIGVNPLITWTALLSLNLAVVNLLPIPALDGGRIVFVLVEMARGGRRLAPQKERFVHAVGFALLIGLIVAVSVNDIRRLLSGWSI